MVNAGKDGRAEVGTGGDQGVVRPTVAAGAWAAFLVAAADLTVTGLRLTLIPDPEIALYLIGLAVLGGAVAGLGAASILTVLARIRATSPGAASVLRPRSPYRSLTVLHVPTEAPTDENRSPAAAPPSHATPCEAVGRSPLSLGGLLTLASHVSAAAP